MSLLTPRLLHAKTTVVLCGFLSCLLYLYLCQQSQAFADANLNNLLSVAIPCGLLSFIAWYQLHCSRDESFKNGRSAFLLILGFAALFRLIGFFTFPILEDDFYRYLWDGYIFIEHGNPYGISPSDYFAVEAIPDNFQDLLSNINYPDIATVYGPLLQGVFGLSFLIAPGELWPLKLLILLADILLIACIIVLMRAYSVKPYFLILYAWSPLVIIEFVVTMHPDIIASLFIFTALLARQRKSFYLMSVSLALAVATKVFAIILVPLLLVFNWKRWSIFLLTLVGVASPFGLTNALLPEGLKAMASQWYFNAPLYALIPSLSFTKVKLLLLTTFSCVYLLAWKRQWWLQSDAIPRGDIAFALFLLAIPALNAWYLIILLPFGVFYASRTLWAASLLVFISYAFSTDQSTINAWLYLVEFGLLFLIFFWEVNIKKKPDQSRA